MQTAFTLLTLLDFEVWSVAESDSSIQKALSFLRLITRYFYFQGGAVGSSDSQTEEGESRPPLREPISSANGGTSTSNNPVSSVTQAGEFRDERSDTEAGQRET